MLRLSKLTDYATVILSYMANDNVRLYSAVDIAEATDLGLPTVSKILKLLLKADVLRSVRGAKGGYTLARTPDKITVATIIAALEGPIAITECSSAVHSCEQAIVCKVRTNWGLINQTIYHALDAITLADMIMPVAVPQEIAIPLSRLSRTLQ